MRFFRGIAIGAMALGLSACASAEDYLSSINPFGSHEKPLEGERRSILTPDPSAQAPNPSNIKPVTLPPAMPVADWMNPGGPSSNAPANIAASGNTVAWKAGADTNFRASAPPVISSNSVFFYDNRRVSAYDLNTGKKNWSTNIAAKNAKTGVSGGGIATDGRAIFVASGLRILKALDIVTGKEIWSAELNEPAHSAPTVADGRIYIVMSSGVISARSTSNGAEIWHYASPARSGGLLNASSPAVYGSLVVVPFSSGELAGLDAATGKVLWTDSLTGTQPVSAVMSLSDVAARPVISGNAVYAGSLAGRLMAVQPASGTKIWEQSVPIAFAPVAAGNGVFVLSLAGDLYAFDNMSGEVRWSLSLPKDKERTIWAGPVLANSSLWLVSNHGALVAVDAGTGLMVSQQTLKEGSALSPIAASGKLVIVTMSGGLIALQ